MNPFVSVAELIIKFYNFLLNLFKKQVTTGSRSMSEIHEEFLSKQKLRHPDIDSIRQQVQNDKAHGNIDKLVETNQELVGTHEVQRGTQNYNIFTMEQLMNQAQTQLDPYAVPT